MNASARRWLRRIAVVAVLVVLGLAARYTLLRTDPVPVTVFRVARGAVEQTVTNSKSGTVRSRHRASLGPELGGRVAELPVREGDRVRRGDLLLRLADEDLRAQVEVRESAVVTARASRGESCTSADNAAREYARQVALARDEIVPEQTVEQYRTRRDATAAACEAAEARILEAAAALEAARVDLRRTIVRAPFDGIVAEVRTEVGEWITPSPPGILIPTVFDLIDPEAVYVSAPLDEVDVGRVREGLPVRVTLDAYPDRSFDGDVVRVAPYVQDAEDQNRTFEIEVELRDGAFARTLSPGTSADVEVVLDTKPDALRIPSYALIEGQRVLVLEDGALRDRAVEIGLRNWDFAEVVAGLEPGEAVVVSLDRAEVEAGAPAAIEAETDR
jgi:HlyD family secretion protein